MALDISRRIALDPTQPEIQRVLERLQGNILRGHGRNFTRNFLLKFKPNTEDVRRVLRSLLPRLVTSAAEQQARDGAGGARGAFVNFFLSAKGYQRLGFSSAQLGELLAEPPPEANVASNFRDGMREHAAELGDPSPDSWEDPYRTPIDALLLLADDDEDDINVQTLELETILREIAVVHVECGAALKQHVRGGGFEHFGFQDGRSQPVFFLKQRSEEGSTTEWDPLEPLSLVLVPDRTVDDEDAFGSFYVFRKLEQNVRGFRAREQELADQLGLQGEDRARVGAMAIGRFRDGTPLVAAERAQGADTVPNDFRFAAARDRCPLHAHIRKMNPRGDLAARGGAASEDSVERSRRIVRRGIPYGERVKKPWQEQTEEELPTGGVGLLFGCFQASIGRQFAFIQRRWADAVDFPADQAGIDPITGTAQGPTANLWNRKWNEPNSAKLKFGRFVTMLGGEFFFAPSKPFLELLVPPK